MSTYTNSLTYITSRASCDVKNGIFDRHPPTQNNCFFFHWTFPKRIFLYLHLHLYLYQSRNDLYLYHSLDDCSPGGCQYDWETTGHFPNECFPHWNSWPATNQQASPTHHSTEGNDGNKFLIFLFPAFSFCIFICVHVCICILSVYTARESSRHYHKSTEGKLLSFTTSSFKIAA